MANPKTYNPTNIRKFLLNNNKYIAFASGHDGDSEIYLTNINGTHQVNLTNHTASDTSPTFSPDDQRIAFASDREGSEKGDADIYIMNIDGTNVIRLTYTPSLDSSFSPAWSPDGKRIAFANKAHNYISTVNVDGTDQTIVTKRLSFDPAWSPDGQNLVFTTYYFDEKHKYEAPETYNGDYEIFLMNINEKERIPRHNGFCVLKD